MAIARVTGQLAKGDTGGVAAGSVAATWPATTTVGNFCLAIVSARATGTNLPTFTAPAGWTSAPPTRAGGTGGSNQDPSVQIFYIANCGARSGSESFSLSANAEAIVYLIEYSGVSTSSPYDTEGNSASSTTATNVTTGTTGFLTASNSLCISCLAVKNQTRSFTTPQNSYSLVRQDQTTDATNANGITTALLELIGGTAAASTTTGATCNVASQHTGVLAVFKPSAGGATVTGAAALTGTGSMTVAGVRKRLGAAALTGTGSMTVAGIRKRFAAAALTGTGSLAAAGVRTRYAAAALTGTGSMTVAGAVAHFAAAALTGLGSLTAAGTRVRLGAADLTAAGAMTVSGVRSRLAAAALTALGTLEAAGTRVVVGAADLLGLGTLHVNNVVPPDYLDSDLAVSYLSETAGTSVAHDPTVSASSIEGAMTADGAP